MRIRRVLFIAAIGAIFVSCSSLAFPKNPESIAKSVVFWDESLPKELCAGLLFANGLIVTSYNGISVEWKKGTMAYIPPGEVTLILDVDFLGKYHGNNIFFQWTFNEGERYYIQGWETNGNPIIRIVNSLEGIPPGGAPYFPLEYKTTILE